MIPKRNFRQDRSRHDRRPIPTGLRILAQGCGAAATLETMCARGSTPTELCQPMVISVMSRETHETSITENGPIVTISQKNSDIGMAPNSITC